MSFDVLSYVRNTFKLKFSTYYNKLDSREVDQLVFAISSEIKKKILEIKKREKEENSENLVDNKNNKKFWEYDDLNVDKLISDVINNYVIQQNSKLWVDYTNLRNYIVRHIENNHYVIYSLKTFDCIVEKVVESMMSLYKYEDVMNGNYDDTFSVCYENACKKLGNQVIDYVTHYMSHLDNPIGEFNDVAHDILKEIMTSNDLNMFDLLTGKYNELIKSRCKSKKKDSKTIIVDCRKHIEIVISSYVGEVGELSRVVDYIDKNLIIRGLDDMDILSGNYDQDIIQLYNKWVIRNNSVKYNKEEEKIKVNIDKKRLSKVIATLLTTATLLSLLSVGGVSLNNYIKENSDSTSISRVDAIDGFYYSKPYFRDNDYYKDMAKNIISVYSKLEQLDNEYYKTISFYSAYVGVDEENEKRLELDIMENLFSLVRDELKTTDDKIGLRDTIKVDDNDVYCFLDYVYDMLIYCGYNEVNVDKYQKLLQKYKYANFGNYYGIVGVMLNNSDKELLNNVMKKYEEYGKELKIELGHLIPNSDYEFFDRYTNNSSKGR